MADERALIQYATPAIVESEEDGDAHDSLARTALRFAIGAGIGEAISAFAFFCATADPDFFIVEILGAVAVCCALFAWLICLPLALLAWKDRDGPRRIAAFALILLAAEVAVPSVIGFLLVS